MLNCFKARTCNHYFWQYLIPNWSQRQKRTTSVSKFRHRKKEFHAKSLDAPRYVSIITINSVLTVVDRWGPSVWSEYPSGRQVWGVSDTTSLHQFLKYNSSLALFINILACLIMSTKIWWLLHPMADTLTGWFASPIGIDVSETTSRVSCSGVAKRLVDTPSLPHRDENQELDVGPLSRPTSHSTSYRENGGSAVGVRTEQYPIQYSRTHVRQFRSTDYRQRK